LPRVLYLGDHKGGSARYLLAALKWANMPVTHLDHAEKPPRALLEGKREWDVVILSDYSARRLGSTADRNLAAQVREEGLGLLMVGGWESFAGKTAGYRGTAVAEVLPVRLASEDDRRNVPTGLLLWPSMAHPVLDGLSFRRPPVVMGFNAFTPRASGQVLMQGLEIRARGRGKTPQVSTGPSRPMLVVGEVGKGRTAAFGTDLAPHWCGGLVDWGRGRVTVTGVEVGEIYLELILRMVTWTAGSLRTRLKPSKEDQE